MAERAASRSRRWSSPDLALRFSSLLPPQHFQRVLASPLRICDAPLGRLSAFFRPSVIANLVESSYFLRYSQRRFRVTHDLCFSPVPLTVSFSATVCTKSSCRSLTCFSSRSMCRVRMPSTFPCLRRSVASRLFSHSISASDCESFILGTSVTDAVASGGVVGVRRVLRLAFKTLPSLAGDSCTRTTVASRGTEVHGPCAGIELESVVGKREAEDGGYVRLTTGTGRTASYTLITTHPV